MALLAVGSQAPEFSLLDQTGNIVQLSSLREAGPVVLFFYPRDETMVCTKEACGFRDAIDSFAERGAAVVGISRDSGRSHADFAKNHRLPYPLLSDVSGLVAASFGVKKVLGLLPGRATFVVDRGGTIRHAYSSAFEAHAHVASALSVVRKLAFPS